MKTAPQILDGRPSQRWRIVALVEGYQFDEVELVTEAQLHLSPCVILKANVGWGLTDNATDFAPEAGLMMSFKAVSHRISLSRPAGHLGLFPTLWAILPIRGYKPLR